MLTKLKNKIFQGFKSLNRDPKLVAIVEKVLSNRLTYLSQEALYDLSEAVRSIEENKIPGRIVETGCALGGSSIVLASVKNKHRELFLYDVFGTIPEPSERDGADVHARYDVIAKGESTGIGDDPYYGYIKNLYNVVIHNFESFGFDLTESNINLVKGLYQDTLTFEAPVSLAHIDCGWYDSVLLSLERIEPFLVSEGCLIIDDYYAYSGCKKAVDEYFKGKNNYKFIHKNRLHILKR